MRLLIIHSQESLSGLFGKPLPFNGWDVSYADEPFNELLLKVDACIDLTFEKHLKRIELYKNASIPVLINSVLITLEELQITDAPIIRLNYWPGFKENAKPEIALDDQHLHRVTTLFEQWGIEMNRTEDVAGFVSPRVISLIINEAYFALGENLSTSEEIDTAMKWGTNYPKGPFEWCQSIGIHRVLALLEKLSVTQPRYMPAPLLKQKANEQ